MSRSFKAISRGSDLAMTQTNMVVQMLRDKYPDIELEIKQVQTSGDRDMKVTLWDLKGAGFFTKQLEEDLLAGKADFAVHSLKDLPTSSDEKLTVAAICPRASVEDCILSRTNVFDINELKKGAVIGTSSLRRAVQIKAARDDFIVKPIRGNVPTRIAKLKDGQYDAIILAKAGLERLGLTNEITLVLDPLKFIPSPAQGALAVQTRRDSEITSLIAALDDETTRLEVQAERMILQRTHCGCHAPVGAYARIIDGVMEIDAFIADLDGISYIRKKACGPPEKALELARKLADEMLNAGGKEILEKIENGK